MNYFNYFSEIEETFNRRRGKFQFLSPLDWALMEDWEKRGVPLHVVLRGIEKVFDNQNGQTTRRRTVKGLGYCREEIEAQYEEWRERQIGKNDGAQENSPPAESETFADDSVREHLARVSEELNSVLKKSDGDLRAVLERVSGRLADLRAEQENDAEHLEKSLSELENMIDEALLEAVESPKFEPLKKQITKNLASYKSKMESEAYERTFNLMLLKELRENAGIPRLSLFYL